MNQLLGIGIQDFEKIRRTNNFYIDKTNFIKEWWETNNEVTLITRPRRFGKTLNMSMLNCFFSNEYKDRNDLFLGLSIWNDEKFRQLQGSYSVIFLTFAGIKSKNYNNFLYDIKHLVNNLYLQFDFLRQSKQLHNIEKERIYFLQNFQNNLSEGDMQNSIRDLSSYLQKHFHKKVLIFLDEYDTPLQEAYLYGYWEDALQFLRPLFSNTFKQNTSLERALLTAIRSQ